MADASFLTIIRRHDSNRAALQIFLVADEVQNSLEQPDHAVCFRPVRVLLTEIEVGRNADDQIRLQSVQARFSRKYLAGVHKFAAVILLVWKVTYLRMHPVLSIQQPNGVVGGQTNAFFNSGKQALAVSVIFCVLESRW